MGLIEYFLAGGAVLVVQGAFTLRTGDMRLLGFLMQPSTRATPGKRVNRLVGGMFFMLSGVAVILVPIIESLRTVPLADWLSSRSGPLLVVATCVGFGALCLARPGVLLKWAQSAYPGVPTAERWILLIPRGVGVCAVAIGIRVLAGLLYYASRIRLR